MLGKKEKKSLSKLLGSRIRFDVPMSGHTSLRVGGPADALAAPKDSGQLAELLGMLENESIPWFLMGGGTNLLVRDAGIRGVVISLAAGFSEIETRSTGSERVLVRAGAGARLSALCRYAAENSLAGMEFATGIPGTVGGAIVMNAGTRQGEIKSVIRAADILRVPDRPETVYREDLRFGYRKLDRKAMMEAVDKHEPIILGGFFELVPAGERDLRQEAQKTLAWRMQAQPSGFSAGCVFRNPSDDMPAGKLIEQAGLKGMKMGGARISETHANFIINSGRATAKDILGLMDAARQRVLSAHGIELEPEIVIVGQ